MPAASSMSNCPTCNTVSLDSSGTCLNPSCPDGARAATIDATRRTAKATALTDRPNSFSSSGRVD